MAIKVLCGLIRNAHNQIFIARRAPHKAMAGKWEFPGGKLEDGEDPKEGLQRELLEELGMTVHVGDYVGTTNHQYPNFKIELIAYQCEFMAATYELTDHDAYAWIMPVELKDYDLAEADLPFISILFQKR